MAGPSVWVRTATFSDGTTVNLGRSDITVIVGANNSGKSEALRNLKAKAELSNNPGVVVTTLELSTEGSTDDVLSWIAQTARKMSGDPENPGFHRGNAQVHKGQVQSWWPNYRDGLHQLSSFFCYHLSADERLTAANPAGSIAMTRAPLTHPIHHLYVNDVLEQTISGKFHEAFGQDLVVHRSAGNQIPLHSGTRPVPSEGKDRVSLEYVTELEKLPTLHTQGDGMRAFVGILLHTMVMRHSILLIDEPEAFLHPPQARQLARLIATALPQDQQVFVATHSGDFLRGILDASSERVRILRLNRIGDVNHVCELSNNSIKSLWSDSLLRYSNVLDGMFHEKVVVTESDSDCRFYAAVRDSQPADADRRKDVMFTHCGGKARIPTVLKALVGVGVPVAAVSDIDLLNDEHPLREIFEALGGDWTVIQQDWSSVKLAIEQKKPDLATSGVKQEIVQILETVKEEYFPKDAARQIEAILRRTSPWSIVKQTGKAYIPAGNASQAFQRLSAQLRSKGVFVVEVGELEGFDRTVGGHGPKWVNAVLEKDLTAVHFEPARTFLNSVAN